MEPAILVFLELHFQLVLLCLPRYLLLHLPRVCIQSVAGLSQRFPLPFLYFFACMYLWRTIMLIRICGSQDMREDHSLLMHVSRGTPSLHIKHFALYVSSGWCWHKLSCSLVLGILHLMVHRTLPSTLSWVSGLFILYCVVPIWTTSHYIDATRNAGMSWVMIEAIIITIIVSLLVLPWPSKLG